MPTCFRVKRKVFSDVDEAIEAATRIAQKTGAPVEIRPGYV